MEKIVTELASAIPNYMVNFISTLSSPKNYPLTKLAKYEEDTEKKLGAALSFVFLSYLILIFINIARLNLSKQIFPEIFLESALQLIFIALFSFAIFLGWRLTGAKANYFNYLIIYSYHAGVFFVLFFLVGLISDGLINYLEPELYKELIMLSKGEIKNLSIPPEELLENENYVKAMIVLGTGYLIIMIWGLFGHGAYRKMNSASFGKMLLSMFVAGIFSWIVIGLIILIRKSVL